MWLECWRMNLLERLGGSHGSRPENRQCGTVKDFSSEMAKNFKMVIWHRYWSKGDRVCWCDTAVEGPSIRDESVGLGDSLNGCKGTGRVRDGSCLCPQYRGNMEIRGFRGTWRGEFYPYHICGAYMIVKWLSSSLLATCNWSSRRCSWLQIKILGVYKYR